MECLYQPARLGRRCEDFLAGEQCVNVEAELAGSLVVLVIGITARCAPGIWPAEIAFQVIPAGALGKLRHRSYGRRDVVLLRDLWTIQPLRFRLSRRQLPAGRGLRQVV